MWDRWDDAMDDVLDELHELRNDNEQLEAQLRQLNAPVPEKEPAELSRERDHNDMYQNRWGQVLAERARKKQLQEALRQVGQ
mgnify:CR=1 FL=1